MSKFEIRKKTISGLLFLFAMFQMAHAQQVWISLYDGQQIKSLAVSSYSGTINAFQNSQKQFTIADGKSIYITLHEGKMLVNDINGPMGSFSTLSFQGDPEAMIRVKPADPLNEARNYEETVFISVVDGHIQIINQIDAELYIAGVIQAEVGLGKPQEFYKAKAIICRTYLYGHINRHQPEGFHLCDGTHCQAYKGKCSNEAVCSAADATKGIILVGSKDSIPILAAYHSNCGGETESAKNAWQTNMPYLVPVTDPYCATQPNATWEKTVSLDEWFQYIMKKGFKPDPSVLVDFDFQQERRIPDYAINDFKLQTKEIRNDLNLRSTFFSISVVGEQVLLKGRGYGHGVGLCQEGAMEMGRRGFKYGEIISFYYKYVNLVPVSDLRIKIPDFSTNTSIATSRR